MIFYELELINWHLTPAPTMRTAIILIKMIPILQVGIGVSMFIQAVMVLKVIVLIAKRINLSHNY